MQVTVPLALVDFLPVVLTGVGFSFYYSSDRFRPSLVQLAFTK
jgi:hypothetical protein